MKKLEYAHQLIKFIGMSPSMFHVVSNLEQMYKKAGYEKVEETALWNLKAGGKYYVIRNGSSIVAFTIPKKQIQGFHMVASHSDSPTFKIKEAPEIVVENKYVKWNVEKYGGMILSTWFDRALSAAGRVVVRNGKKLEEKLVNLDRDLLVIPSVAIHMNRDINKGVSYNPQNDMSPLLTMGQEKEGLSKLLCEELHVKEENILGFDLFLYVREEGKVVGQQNDFIVSPKLDDLQMVYAANTAMTEADSDAYINMCITFDNEEVGSGTKQGADSTFLQDVMERIRENLAISTEEYLQMLARSFMISADNAHAVHPNHPEYADPTNRPYLNGGIVIKYHGAQKYTTDAMSAAYIKQLCKETGITYQTYCNRSDIAGGSTLGNISTTHISVASVDIGLPQLAMHSAVETAGVKDTQDGVKLFQTFYNQAE